MKSETTLEARLRQWTPRPPSEKLKERIFHPTRGGNAESANPGWSWLAPVTAAFVLSMAALTSPHPDWDAAKSMAQLGAEGGRDGWVNSVGSDINVVNTIFEWTNSGHTRSSIGAFVLYNTNGLKH